MIHTWFIENGRRRKGENYICDNCNKEFIGRKNKQRLYCSRECSHQAKTNRIQLQCGYCKNTIEKTASKLKNSKSGLVFCDKKCKDKAQSIQGGCKDIQPSHYGSETGIIKKLIRKASNPKCIDCPEDRRWALQTHHVDGNRKNNDIKNIEVVCATCHIKRHLFIKDNKWMYSTRVLTPRDKIEGL